MNSQTDSNLLSDRRVQGDLNRLVKWVRKAQTVVWFTGAGISTESGLPDYRYADNENTRKALKLPPIAKFTSLEELQPNASHFAITEFEQIGKCRFLVSQNVDNLHRKSGFPPDKLAELHGNQLRMRCGSCDGSFPMSQFRTPSGGRKRKNGRFIPDVCPDCGEKVKNSVVNFGDPMPAEELGNAYHWARQADLMMVVGSSCLVRPAADVPREAKEHGAKLVVINLGETSLDSICDLRVTIKAGELLSALLNRVKT